MARDVAARLDPEIADCRIGPFRLGDDVNRLAAVQSAAATEAVVFYAARILEVLAAEAVRKLHFEPSASTCSNLFTLEQYTLMPTQTRYWAHGVRCLGNVVRHLLRDVHPDEGLVASAFTESILKWFFCDFEFGPQRPSLTVDGDAWNLCGASAVNDVRRIVDLLHSPADAAAAGALPDFGDIQSAVVPAVVAEIWIGQGRLLVPPALEVVEKSLLRHKNDLRLRQMRTLALGRLGRLDEARIAADELLADKNPDDESLGISAGVYKRIWQKDPARIECLETARKLYQRGWKKSKPAPTYLGINAAACALWSGHDALARTIATQVAALIEERTRAAVWDADRADFWTRVTHAEALLLQGRLTDAAIAYEAARTAFAEEKGSWEYSTLPQRRQILTAMKLSITDAELERRAAAKADAVLPAVRVGVTGHRRVADGPVLRRQISAALRRACCAADGGAPKRLILVDALAEGSDRIVADVALSAELGGGLIAVLPLETAEYEKDFPEAASIAAFRGLLAAADVVQIVPQGDGRTHGNDAPPEITGDLRNEQYERVGREVVHQSDVLLAIWDGKPAAGRGGTGDIVAYARQLQRPLLWIHSAPPHDLRFEPADAEPSR